MFNRFVCILFCFTIISCNQDVGSNRPLLKKQAKESKTIKNTYNKIYTSPTKEVANSKWPVLFDDLDFANMELVLERQTKRFIQKICK